LLVPFFAFLVEFAWATHISQGTDALRLTAATCSQTHLLCCCSTLPFLPFTWWLAL
jgi:hypothetical protein